MAVKSIVKVSELEGAKRLDAEYYQPIYALMVNKLKADFPHFSIPNPLNPLRG
jgi:hypothetical protein